METKPQSKAKAKTTPPPAPIDDRIVSLQAEIDRLRSALEWVDRHADVPWLEKFRTHARRALSGNA